ncbi:MAG: hemerythrin domain-containing protein [Pseudomonadota bacterium]|nr:hemerythrin domain-containing protein [Pseudomonadota bacterium]
MRNESPSFTYDHPENHVEYRSAISAPLRAAMFDIPREQWSAYPQFRGEAEFWTQIHEGLLNASATLPAWLKQFMEAGDEGQMRALAPRIAGLGGQLVHHAHGHHHIEDHHFFPAFLRLFPQLEHPLEMLDGDHKVLTEVLDDLEAAVKAFPVAPQGSDRQMREAWLKGASVLLPAAERLDALFIRHIGDEEEICIPAMLKL